MAPGMAGAGRGGEAAGAPAGGGGGGETKGERTTREALERENGRLRRLARELHARLAREQGEAREQLRRLAEQDKAERAALSEKFGDGLRGVQEKLDEDGKARNAVSEENRALRERLAGLIERVELREAQVAQQLEAKGLEVQLAEAKRRHQEGLGKQLQLQLEASQARLDAHASTEAELRGQLAEYGQKFELFQETVSRSNEAMASFKSGMAETSKLTKKLQKENLKLQTEMEGLRRKTHESDVALVELLSEREALKAENAKLRSAAANVHGHPDYRRLLHQKERLEGLCRALRGGAAAESTDDGAGADVGAGGGAGAQE